MKFPKLLVFLLSLVALVGLVAHLSDAQSRGRGKPDTEVEDEPLEQPLPHGIKVRAFIHRPRVVEHNHLGSCTVTVDDNINNFGITGWEVPATGITFRLKNSSVPASVAPDANRTAARTQIQNAINTWTGPDSSKSGKLILSPQTTTAKGARYDSVNAILWGRLSPWTIAVTYVWYYTDTGLIAQVDMVFNNRYPWAIFADLPECQTSPHAYDFPNILIHEMGHVWGLDDLYDDAQKDLTMYGFGGGGEVKKRTLGTGDVSGINAVLP